MTMEEMAVTATANANAAKARGFTIEYDDAEPSLDVPCLLD